MSKTSYFELQDEEFKVSKDSQDSKDQRWSIKRGCCYGLIVITLLILVTLILIFGVFKVHKNNYSKNNAVNDISTVMQDAINNNETQNNILTVSDSDMEKYHKAFEAFDFDGDSKLNTNEFTDLIEYTSKESEVFNVIDIDQDGVLCFREVIIFLKVASQHDGMAHTYATLYAPSIEYYFNYTAPNNQSDPLFLHKLDIWYEYAAVLFFTQYDPGYKNYITYFDYLTAGTNISFANFDKDGDGYVDFNEFVNGSLNYDGINFLASNNAFSVSNGTKQLYSTLNMTHMLATYDIQTVDLFIPKTGVDGFYFYQGRRIMVSWSCVGTGVACGVALGMTVFCCALTVLGGAPACYACVMATAIACATAGGTCADSLLNSAAEGGVLKYPVTDYAYCIQFYSVNPSGNGYSWSTSYEGSTMGYPDIYIEVSNGCETKYTSTHTPDSEYETLYFDDKMCFWNPDCDEWYTFELWDYDTFGSDEKIAKFDAELWHLVESHNEVSNLRGIKYKFVVQPGTN